MLDLALRLRRQDFDLDLRLAATTRSLALFGPSGCGKTTSLLAVAGLRRPDHGRIALDGRVLFDSDAGVDVPAAQRHLGVVFQEGRLFPHLNVRDNLLYGRRGRRPDAGFEAWVERLGLAPLLARKPAGLSGGEARRVALGRALLADPAALLLDEPLTGLHRDARADVLAHLRGLRRALDLPILLVSHQVDEVLALADAVALMDDGRVREIVDVHAFAARHAAPAG